VKSRAVLGESILDRGRSFVFLVWELFSPNILLYLPVFKHDKLSLLLQQQLLIVCRGRKAAEPSRVIISWCGTCRGCLAVMGVHLKVWRLRVKNWLVEYHWIRQDLQRLACLSWHKGLVHRLLGSSQMIIVSFADPIVSVDSILTVLFFPGH